MNETAPGGSPTAAVHAAASLPILTYHSLDLSGSVVSVAPADFADHIACLADLGFRSITLRDAVLHRQRTGEWPTPAVVLTFDDGYANVHATALPILTRHRFVATIFVVSGHVGGRND